jgi:hypothetical protein
MPRHWLLNEARSALAAFFVPVLAGWAVLLPLAYVVERPLILWTAPLLGAHWVATAKVSLACLILVATGWTVGRTHRAAPLPGVFAFAVTLAFCNCDPSSVVDIPTLARLAAGALHDTGYLSPLATTAAQHILLFGSLIAGGLLSRPPRPPLSLFEGRPPQAGPQS